MNPARVARVFRHMQQHVPEEQVFKMNIVFSNLMVLMKLRSRTAQYATYAIVQLIVAATDKIRNN